MQRILLLLDADKPNTNLINFACHMADAARSKLIGLILENSNSGYVPAGFMDIPYASGSSRLKDIPATSVSSERAENLIREQCRHKNIGEILFIGNADPLHKVVYETRFADLLIVDPEISLYGFSARLPSHLIREILSKSECPVLLAPEKFDEVEEVVFCYDGTASSIFAIKQFTYLFPEFRNRKVTLLEVNRSGSEEFNGGHRSMMNWLREHYHLVYYYALSGEVKDRLFTYFFLKRKKMIVMGSYGRTVLSNLFKKSSADILIRMVDLPLFIAHH